MANPARVLIMGGRSKIADHLIRHLLPQNIEITATVRRKWHPDYTDQIRIIHFPLGRTVKPPVNTWMEGFDAVIFIPPITLLPVFLPALKQFGVKRIICLSSHNVTLRATDPIYIELAEAEAAVMESGIPYFILRPTMIVGHTRHNIGRLIDFAKKWGWLPIPGRGQALQNPIDYRDVARALEYVYLRSDMSAGCKSISGPDIIPLRAVYEMIARHVKRSPLIIPIPLWMLKLATKAWGIFGKTFPINSTQIQHIMDDKSVTHAHLRDWKAQIGVETMVKDMIENASGPLT